MTENNLSLSNGEPAPDFLLRDPSGHPHALSHYRGRIVVLNFWSAECPWSERADAEIAAMMADWGGRVEWISIASNANESLADIARKAEARSLPLVLPDPDQMAADLYGAEMTPHLFVVDAAGILRYQGAFDDVSFRKPLASRTYLKEAVEALMEGREPERGAAPAYGCTIVRFADPDRPGGASG